MLPLGQTFAAASALREARGREGWREPGVRSELDA